VKLIFCKSKWEMWDDSLDVFLERVVGDRFDATELYLASVRESPAVVRSMHAARGLDIVAQILTEGDTADAHLESLERFAADAIETDPILVNLHAGRDIFDFADNVRIFERIVRLSQESSIPFAVETHRSRPTYNAIDTVRYLREIPDLRLTADFSHWMVVHESDLSDQNANVQTAIDRSIHIHARVGYAEGPQVPDPRAPEWEGHVDRHIDLWRRIVQARSTSGAPFLTITPEFGPPDYMHTSPFSRAPVADAWEVNVFMHELLLERFPLNQEQAPFGYDHSSR
jgi:sugar phosphate isomerase/epimerase